MTDKKLDQILKQALAPEIDEKEIRVLKMRQGNMKKFNKIGKSAAAVVAAGIIGVGGLGYFNPVLAAKIPMIGKIFEKVEDQVTYSGDYADKGTVLTNEDPAGNLDTSDYSVSDKGITLTASEIYCDGYSVFLTVNIEAEDADFTHIPEHYTGVNAADNRTAAGFYIGGTWGVDGNSSEQLQNTFEGEVIDSHTFAGMLKMDLAEKASGSGELRLNVNGLGYDDDRIFQFFIFLLPSYLSQQRHAPGQFVDFLLCAADGNPKIIQFFSRNLFHLFHKLLIGLAALSQIGEVHHSQIRKFRLIQSFTNSLEHMGIPL